jgi:hypothetical protein
MTLSQGEFLQSPLLRVPVLIAEFLLQQSQFSPRALLCHFKATPSTSLRLQLSYYTHRHLERLVKLLPLAAA